MKQVNKCMGSGSPRSILRQRFSRACNDVAPCSEDVQRPCDWRCQNGKILFEVVLKEMMFLNKNVEGMFKGKCFNDVMEVVRSRIRLCGGS